MTDIQTEKAFQKQQGVFLNSKKLSVHKTSDGVRFYKNIGLGKCLFTLGALPAAANALSNFGGLTFRFRLQNPQRSDQRKLRRQKVPLHWRCQHPWKNPQVSVYLRRVGACFVRSFVNY